MIISQKKLLRLSMKEKRALLFQQDPEAGHKLTILFFKFFELSSSLIIGGYWPIGSELDIRPLLKKLMTLGHQCALPCVTPQGLEFHLWTDLIGLTKGTFQTPEPPLSSELVIPDVLLVPLLSFDKRGHRLGYGQGHFDRYLHKHPILTIGIGFKGQEIETVPTQSHDFSLDYILTEQGIIPQKKKHKIIKIRRASPCLIQKT